MMYPSNNLPTTSHFPYALALLVHPVGRRYTSSPPPLESPRLIPLHTYELNHWMFNAACRYSVTVWRSLHNYCFVSRIRLAPLLPGQVFIAGRKARVSSTHGRVQGVQAW